MHPSDDEFDDRSKAEYAVPKAQFLRHFFFGDLALDESRDGVGPEEHGLLHFGSIGASDLTRHLGPGGLEE